VTCRPAALDRRLPGPFVALPAPRPVIVAKRKHGDLRDRWRWEGDMIGTAGRGWRVLRHVLGIHGRRLLSGRAADPEAAIELHWLGSRAPAAILVKLDEAARIIEVKIDAALPVPFRRGRFVFTDLDVDVVRDASGAVSARDWGVFEARAASLGYTDASRAVAAAGEAFGLHLLAVWEPSLERDVAAVLAASGTAVAARPGQPGATVLVSGPPWLRRAGRLDAGGGETVLWSVAEGRPGRRWRSLRLSVGGTVVSDLLLELDAVGSWTRLEMSAAAGILTLHPEPDGRSVHGNIVTERGVVPLALPWSPGHRLLLLDEPVAAAALGRGVDEPEAGPAIVVDGRLEPLEIRRADRPLRPTDGLPGPSWPLEVDAATS
jgi:hypothetical protein